MQPGEFGGTMRSMKGFFSLLNLSFIPRNQDFGLLVLRTTLGVGMLVLNGWKKVELLMGWGGWAQTKGVAAASIEKMRLAGIKNFPDPLQIGSHLSLGLAAFAEVVCSALLVIGFCTRFASLVLAFTMGVAFFIVKHAVLTGKDSGEMAALYMLGYVTLFLAGPGKFSFDGSGDSGGGGGGKPH